MKTLQVTTKKLIVASVAYLLIPVLIFLWGWMNIWWALMVNGLLAAAFYCLVLDVRRGENGRDRIVSRRAIWICCGAAALVLLYTGIGGTGYQNHDYFKHNAVLHDLVVRDWPVTYETGMRLVYSFGYYLPAAVIGKLMGWDAAQVGLWLWSFAGLVLTLAWVSVLVERKSTLWPVVAFILLGGLDFFGFYWFNGWMPRWGDHIEWWATFAQYSAVFTQIIWVPQHALAAWVATGLIIFALDTKALRAWLPLVVALTCLWSPFVAVGLAILLVADMVVKRKVRWEYFYLRSAISAVVVAAAVGGFLYTNTYPNESGWVWTNFPWSKNFIRFICFFLLEIGLLSAAVYGLTRAHFTRIERLWLVALLVLLLLLPLTKFGAANDLVMRSSMPVLMAVWLLLLKKMSHIRWQWSGGCIILAVILFFSALTGLEEWARSMRYYNFGLTVEHEVKAVPFIDYGDQYLGRTPAGAAAMFYK